MLKNTTLSLLAITTILACNVTKKKADTKITDNINLGEVQVKAERKEPELQYQATETKLNDLIHTRLEVSFDYKNQHLLGKASLSFKPHFYTTNVLDLDAKSMQIERVGLLLAKDTVSLKYTYASDKLHILLDKSYTRNELYKIFVQYIAKPNEVSQKGSAAISDAKGLYFINPNRETPDKPRQIWTQGETQSNSCWFPTIDVPNEKHTQEIFITADANDVTLSNGDLIYSKQNKNGTHTDYWKQDKPHAVYLTMMTVGEFAIVKDKWRDTMEVNYYVEKEYAPYAKMIFGNTPEMLETFSKTLGVDYPWDKYSQVVVRDYVSGAMENTSAVVHMEALQHDAREHLDATYEDVVSHELFHHWFGDLVTAESWSNLPLNESFATYGEYIWHEQKYGRMYADKEFEANLQSYLRSKNKHKIIPIRYKYQSREDMFDVVSYAKGGRILHMLRYAVGDEAFYKSLQLYLTRFAFKNTEIHDLRMCFEEVSGRDLNWFFNQWFLKSGHPQLDVKYNYSNGNHSVRIIVKQSQDSAVGLYTIPLALDVYTGNKTNRENVIISHKADTFEFSYVQKISLTNLDAEKVLLGILRDNKTDAEYLFQLQHAENFIDKKQAVSAIINIGRLDSLQLIEAVTYCLNHPFYGVKELGLNLLSKQKLSIKEQFETQILALSNFKEEAIIRSGAINTLADIDKIKFKPQILKALNDSAYSVVSSALAQLVDVDEEAALKFCKDNENAKSGMLQANIASIYTMVAKDNKNAYFKNQISKNGYYGFTILSAYGKYLKASNDAIVSEGVDQIIDYVGKGNLGYNQYAVKNILNDLRQHYKENMKELDKSKEPNSAKAQAYTGILNQLDKLESKLKSLSDIEE